MRYDPAKNIYDACVYQIEASLIRWKSGKLYVRFNTLTNIEVNVNQGTGLGSTPGVVIEKKGVKNTTAEQHLEYKMDISKGHFYTITTKPTESETDVVLEFQYWIEGVQYTSGE